MSFDCCVYGRGTNMNTVDMAFDCCMYDPVTNLVVAATVLVDCCVHGRRTNTNTAVVASVDCCICPSSYYLIVVSSTLQIRPGHKY